MIAAIFDIDGTILPGRVSTDRLFVQYLVEKRIVNFSHLARMLCFALTRLPWGKEIMIKKNKAYLTGIPKQKLLDIRKDFFEQRIIPNIPESSRALIKDHQFQGHRIILISAALQPLVDLWKLELEADEGIGTVPAIDEQGSYTGKIEGEWPYGKGKSYWLRYVEKKYTLDLVKCYGYGDHESDRFFLEQLGHPVVVNPTRKMRSIAQKRHWLITDAL